MDPKAVVIIVPTFTLPGATTVDVFAEDLTAHNLYTVNFLVPGVGVGETPLQSVSIFPNPAKGFIYLVNAGNSNITITGIDGKVVRTISNFNGTTIDLGNQAAGVYLLSIERQDGSVVRKKVVLN